MIRIFSHYVPKLAFILLLLETLILLVAASMSSPLWFGQARSPYPEQATYLAPLAFALLIILCMSALGMYQHGSREAIRTSLVRIMPSFALAFGLISALVAVRPDIYPGGAAHGAVFVLGAAGVLLARLVVFKSAESALLEARVMFVGSGPLARECIEVAGGKLGLHQLNVVACIALADETACVPQARPLSANESLLAMAHKVAATEIVVTVSNRRSSNFPVRQLLECALGGLTVLDAATFFEREACQIRIDSLHPSYLIFGGGFDQGFVRAASKRVFDIVASLAIGAAALPVMAATALAILLDDGGPVLYRQERVGKDGRLFKVLKFRSMRRDAEKSGTPSWAAADDARVTRVGRLIRKLRIDELPQMFNVLKGEMSFVGPRPERAYFVEQLIDEVPYYNVRHGIKPGVTGLAQVRYQYGASVQDAVQKLQYDLYYVKNNSLFLDLLILIDTVQVVLFGKGGR
ncbi:MAG: TIGR03013 family XrtA/PEP-CTERM system glycosyltransferase [Pseudomonadota bacterium]